MMRTVVVADDSEAVRELIKDALVEHGYRVFDVEDGGDALQFARMHPVDLLITDLVMPNKEGIETLREMRSIQPNAKIIAMSGTSEPSYLKSARLLGAHATLRKPFDLHRLVETVAEVLNTEQPAVGGLTGQPR